MCNARINYEKGVLPEYLDPVSVFNDNAMTHMLPVTEYFFQKAGFFHLKKVILGCDIKSVYRITNIKCLCGFNCALFSENIVLMSTNRYLESGNEFWNRILLQITTRWHYLWSAMTYIDLCPTTSHTH